MKISADGAGQGAAARRIVVVPMPLKVGVFHPGTQHSWQTAIAFQEAGQLHWYATSIFYQPQRWPYRVERFLPSRAADPLHRRFMRRFTPLLEPNLVRQFGLSEWVQQGAGALRLNAISERLGHRMRQRFGRRVIAQIEREPVDILWGYDGCSLHAFRWAKRRGIRCILDRTMMHNTTSNRLITEEHARNPDFFIGPWTPKAQSLIDAEDEEMALADHVVVGSANCADSLVANGCPGPKIRIINYGYDEHFFPETCPLREPPGGRALRFLFVGQVHPRKGVAHMLKAFARIPAEVASLTLVGGLGIPAATFARYADRVRHVPSVPRSDVIAHYAAADCFIFPSLVEGSAVVLREIAGVGLGGIHTRAAGDGVEPGVSGRLVATASADEIVHSVMALVDDPDQCAAWSRASWNGRSERTGASYRRRVRDFVHSLAV